MTQHVVMTPPVMTVPDEAPRSGHRLKIVINNVVITKCHPSKKVIKPAVKPFGSIIFDDFCTA